MTIPSPPSASLSPEVAASVLGCGPVLVCLGCRDKTPQVGGLHSRHLFSHGTQGETPEVEVSAGLFFSEVSLLGLQMATFLLCHVVLPLCVRDHIEGLSLIFHER